MPSKQRPVSSAASFYSEATPGLTRRGQGRIRQTTTSSLFPYSVVRPPTDHPIQSPFGDPPSLSPPNVHRDYRQSDHSLETPYTSETPLYARSDYDEPEFTQSPSTYSRSSYAGMTTAPATARAKHVTLGTLGDIREEDERSDRSSELPYTATAADGKGWGGGELVMSPEALTANSIGWTGRPRTDGSWFTTTTAANQKERNIVENEQGPFADTDIVLDQERKNPMQRRSTLPSVLELEDLAKTQTQPPTQSARRLISPASASGLEPMTPAAQQRLGRMSVAPARYAEETRIRDGSISEKRSVQVAETLKKTTGIIRFHQVWRPFIVFGLLLVAALLLPISLLNNPGPASRYLIAPADAFSHPPRGMANVTLGANGWCSLDPTMDCQVYRKGDFTAKDSVYNLGEDQLLATLGDLLTALCVMTWLTTLFYLTHAFLHFFLFFSLNLPFTHLLDEAALLAPNGAPGKNAAQAEVDIRVRCEKPPFESMEWVWWAWWAHRRAPVGYIFAVLSSVLAIASFGVVLGLKRSLASEIKTDNVELG